MKKLLYPLLALALIALASCDKDKEKNDDNCIETRSAGVIEVDAPDSVAVNTVAVIEVKFQVINGCGQFDRFTETTENNEITIGVQALYTGCTCTQDAPIRTVEYEFSADTPRDYVLNFESGDGDFITEVITVY